MEKALRHLIGECVGHLRLPKVYKATMYLSEKFVIKASRRRFHKKIPRFEDFTAIVTIGKPNFAERKFIKLCKKAGEKFPIKEVQLKLTK